MKRYSVNVTRFLSSTTQYSITNRKRMARQGLTYGLIFLRIYKGYGKRDPPPREQVQPHKALFFIYASSFSIYRKTNSLRFTFHWL